MKNKKFKKELFAIALETHRFNRYNTLVKKRLKQQETSENKQKPKFLSHREIQNETGVNEATVRNCFCGNSVSLESTLALRDWAGLNIDDFYK